MTLYLKYRPQTLSDLDLDGARESLIKVVKSGKIPHAFLFSGPRGTGKTSAARILAKVINCEKRKEGEFEPCNKCYQCDSITKGENLDVIELDAASHRGIDDIRVLRDAVKLAPSQAKKKIYIIDEAHMLTLEASNALLKTLEEPPEHVVFILATTNPEKLIETIRSRTTGVPFTRATSNEIVSRLEKVAEGEKIKTDTGALTVIAQASEGSFRDAVKQFEQLTTQGINLNKDTVSEYLFKNKAFDPGSFIEVIAKADTKKALEEIENAVSKGVTALYMTKKILEVLRGYLMVKMGFEGGDIKTLKKEQLIELMKLFSDAQRQIPGSYIEQIPLELAVISWCEHLPKNDDPKPPVAQKVLTPKKENDPDPGIDLPGKKTEAIEPVEGDVGEISHDVWVRILTNIRPKNTSTEALLRAAQPLKYDGKILTLGVYYSFHKERLEGTPHRDLLETALEEILGNKVRVVCMLAQPPAKPKEEVEVVLTEDKDEDIIKIAKEIFGG